jgi:hypothetical protein
MYDHKFVDKEKIDFCDQAGGWLTGFVDIAIDEMVKCVSES